MDAPDDTPTREVPVPPELAAALAELCRRYTPDAVAAALRAAEAVAKKLSEFS